MSAARHAAIVLAAGGSARLGSPKQLLTRAGEPLVRRALRLVLDTRPSRTLVVTGHGSDAVAAALAGLVFERVENARWRDGLSSSLALAAEALAAHDGPTLVVLCDQPALDADHLGGLIERAANAESHCAATYCGDMLGAPAVVSAVLLASARGLGGDRGLGAMLRALPSASVAQLEAPELALDLDTPDDVAEARRRGWVDAAKGGRNAQ